MAAKQRLTKGRMKARQRKMHLVAREGRGRRGRPSPSSSTPSPRHSVDTQYRPIFGNSLRVPGGAAPVLREDLPHSREPHSSPGHSQGETIMLEDMEGGEA